MQVGIHLYAFLSLRKEKKKRKERNHYFMYKQEIIIYTS
jgi:hypothetical protein